LHLNLSGSGRPIELSQANLGDSEEKLKGRPNVDL
jgi:hypothetical protein